MDTAPEVKPHRDGHFAEKIVFVDGLWGCGKTMFSPICAAFDRVELLNFSFSIEYTCALHYLKNMTKEAATTLVRMHTDLMLYNSMQARETNFRFSDLSSIFKDAHTWRYLKRLFQAGDELVPDRIVKEKPILHIATHNLLGFSEPIYAGLGHRAVFIEIVRHPLYMVKQQALNMKRLIGGPRDLTIYYTHGKQQFPYYVRGWEDIFLKSNPTEKAIHYIDQVSRLTEEQKVLLKSKYNAQILTIPFEVFVVDPEPYIKKIEAILETKATATTRKMMKKQNVPREIYADGIALKIYKRCGWTPPVSNSNQTEFAKRRRDITTEISPKVLKMLDRLCDDYENNYLTSEEFITQKAS